LELQTFSPFIVPEEIKVLATTEQLSKAVKKRLLPSRIEKLAQAPTEQKVFGLIGLVLFIIIGVKFKFIPVVPLNNFLDFNKMFRHFKP
jgi:hypothetical protein